MRVGMSITSQCAVMFWLELRQKSTVQFAEFPFFWFQGLPAHSLLPFPSPSAMPVLQAGRKMWYQERNTDVPGSCLVPSIFFRSGFILYRFQVTDLAENE